MSAYAAAVAHVIGHLSANTALMGAIGGRMFEGVVPDAANAAYPLVVVQGYTDPTDVRTQGGIYMTTVQLTVRAYSSTPESLVGSIGPLIPLADAIDTLDGTRGGAVVTCLRVGEMNDVRRDTGAIVRSLGGLFRLEVAAVPG
jgi:hypothetical protein